MKTLINIFLVLLVSFSVVFSQQRIIQTVNNWSPVPNSLIIDSLNSGSSLETEGQVFRTYGETVNQGWGWVTQTEWSKDFWEPPILPDTLVVNTKIITGVNLSEFVIGYAFQGSFGWYAGGGEKISLDSTIWQRVNLDVSWIRKKIGPQRFDRIYLSFQPAALDSCYVGGEVMINSLSGIDSLGLEEVYDDFKGPISTGVEKQIPKRFVLEQNYPNPFNPVTTIRFTLLQKEQVNLTVYNLLGQTVKTLLNEEKQKGSYEVKFDASKLPSGTYYCRLQTGSSVETKKMLLVK